MFKKLLMARVGAGFISLAAFQTAFAADLAPLPPAGPALLGDVTLYGWAPMISGKVGVNGYGPFDIPDSNGDIDNIIKALNGFFMGNASLRYGDWGVFGDVVWADLGQGNTTANGYASAQSDLSAFVGTAALTYSLIDAPDGHLDALAGARFWSVDAGVKLSILGGALDVSEKENISWVDPLVGLRGRYSISPDVFVAGSGAIGGFSLGSDFMWDVAASMGYNFNDNFSAEIGYRALGTDYKSHGDVIDIVAHGPVIGLTGRF